MMSKCHKCQTLPMIPSDEAKVYIIFEHELLLQKMRELLKVLGYKYSEEEDAIIIECSNFRLFLENLYERSNFSSPERNGILVLVLGKDEKLTIGSFKRAKPLDTWFSIIEAEEYLSILEEGRLVVYFQPIVSYDLKVIGQECLIRGVKSDGSLLPPLTLFRLAEKTNTLFYLDRACREASIKTAALKSLYDLMIFINFTPSSIYDPAFCLQTTVSWVNHFGFNPSMVVFEVVESQKIEDVKHLGNILDYYRQNGFRVALDDVGSGYSNLEMLVNLRPDIVKIEKEIVRNVNYDSLKQSIVSALVRICKEANIKSLAEGVETKDEFEYLKDKVDYFQGFLISKPSSEPVRVL
ncbi:MAG: EAL domain-containing protein [Synergistetes bacterium]|nr:EAL domain-containing protein [Synergistota bacterium]MDW8191684.1 EAL domain-containing protein [Synergistota bacterium]